MKGSKLFEIQKNLLKSFFFTKTKNICGPPFFLLCFHWEQLEIFHLFKFVHVQLFWEFRILLFWHPVHHLISFLNNLIRSNQTYQLVNLDAVTELSVKDFFQRIPSKVGPLYWNHFQMKPNMPERSRSPILDLIQFWLRIDLFSLGFFCKKR